MITVAEPDSEPAPARPRPGPQSESESAGRTPPPPSFQPPGPGDGASAGGAPQPDDPARVDRPHPCRPCPKAVLMALLKLLWSYLCLKKQYINDILVVQIPHLSRKALEIFLSVPVFKLCQKGAWS